MGILIRALLMHGWRDTSYMQVYTDILQEYDRMYMIRSYIFHFSIC